MWLQRVCALTITHRTYVSIDVQSVCAESALAACSQHSDQAIIGRSSSLVIIGSCSGWILILWPLQMPITVVKQSVIPSWLRSINAQLKGWEAGLEEVTIDRTMESQHNIIYLQQDITPTWVWIQFIISEMESVFGPWEGKQCSPKYLLLRLPYTKEKP